MKKLLAFALIAVLTVCCFAACGESAASYADNIPVADLAAAADAALGDSSLTVVPDNYLINMNGLDLAAFEEYAVKMKMVDASIDEYGIFKAPDDASVSAIEKTAKDYLAMRLATWNHSYLAEEKPKMEKATVNVMGRYVMYTILSSADTTAAGSAMEKALTPAE